ncbi:MAG: enoyl-CoA hydratase [Pseudomonadota bacterium]
MGDPVLRQDVEGIATLTLNAPARLNTLSDAMLAALAAHLAALRDDGDVRVVILAAAGRAFSAGHDLGEMTAARAAPDGGRAAFEDLFARCARVMTALPLLPQPVIPRVQGVATAAGCQLVAQCDMAVAADTARFGVNGIDVGLFCSTPMVPLTRAIPAKAAFEMLTTGRFLGAPEALEAGLINRVVPAAELEAQTLALAQQIAAKPAEVIALGKAAFHRQMRMGLEDAYAFTGPVMAGNMLMDAAENGIGRFLNKE